MARYPFIIMITAINQATGIFIYVHIIHSTIPFFLLSIFFCLFIAQNNEKYFQSFSFVVRPFANGQHFETCLECCDNKYHNEFYALFCAIQ